MKEKVLHKVFTKYDIVIERINVPSIDCDLSNLSGTSSLVKSPDCKTMVYHLTGLQNGLEGVKFATYKRKRHRRYVLGCDPSDGKI